MKTIALLCFALSVPAFAAPESFPHQMAVSELKHEAYYRSVGIQFQRADGTYVSPATAATVDRVLMQKDGASYAIAFYQNDGGVLTLLAQPIVISNALRPPFGTVVKVDGEDLSCTRIQVAGERVELYVKRGKLVEVRTPDKDPNKAPDRMAPNVTPPAAQEPRRP